MAMTMLSQETMDEARRMAEQAGSWRRGTSKLSGETFWIIDSRSEPGVAHWVALDARGCTCKRNRYRGNCAHAAAVRLVNAGAVQNRCQQAGCQQPATEDGFCREHMLDPFFG